MRHNMGTLDRRLRLVVAVVLVVAGVVVGPGGVVPIVLYVLAGVMVATSLVGSCPLYTVFGISTRPQGAARSSRARASTTR